MVQSLEIKLTFRIKSLGQQKRLIFNSFPAIKVHLSLGNFDKYVVLFFIDLYSLGDINYHDIFTKNYK
jgi:hypothetical protein